MYSLKNKSILVTGASGTVGKALISRLLEDKPKVIYAIDHYEKGIFELEHLYDKENYPVIPLIADIRDQDRMHRLTSDIDVIFHGAAIKHVTLAERAPFDAIKTNIIGLQNIINAALSNNVEKVLFMSSDKAANSTNVMGSTKVLGEKMMSAVMNSIKKEQNTAFFSTRFGNVMGSNGSVTTLFTQQILKGGPITITSKEMTRFVMGIEQAVDLLVESVKIATGGEVFVTKMPSLNINDLAEVLIEYYKPITKKESIEIKYIGARPGEKLYEELVTDEEVRRTSEENNFFVIRPAFDKVFSYYNTKETYDQTDRKPANLQYYRSDQVNLMSHTEIMDFLVQNKILDSKIDLNNNLINKRTA